MGTLLERWLSRAQETASATPLTPPLPQKRSVSHVELPSPRRSPRLSKATEANAPASAQAPRRVRRRLLSAGSANEFEPDEPPAKPAAMVAGFSDYERERLANIERNNEMLRELGLLSGGLGPPVQQRERERPRKRSEPAAHDTSFAERRRSSRLSGQAAEVSHLTADVAGSPQKLAAAAPRVATLGEAITMDDDARAPGVPFDALGGVVFRGHKHAVYSLAPTPCGRFVAAAGGQGMTSFFAVPDASTGAFLGSARVHARWIGDIKWVYDDAFVTCAEDGTLLLSRAVLDSAYSGVSVVPTGRVDRGQLHTAGIFALDASGCSLVTGSKDRSVGLARVAEAALVPERSIAGASDDVIKAVRWDPQSGARVFAAAGNDQHVRLFDVRAGDLPVHAYHLHGASVNALCFDAAGMRLASSGFDGLVVMYDVRAQRALFQTSAHLFSPATAFRTSIITHPEFSRAGTHVMAPSPVRPVVSLLDATTGERCRVIDTEAVVSAFCETASMAVLAAGKNWLCAVRSSALFESTAEL